MFACYIDGFLRPLHLAGIGSADDGQQIGGLFASIAESTAESNRHRNRIILIEDSFVLGAILVLPIDSPLSGQHEEHLIGRVNVRRSAFAGFRLNQAEIEISVVLDGWH